MTARTPHDTPSQRRADRARQALAAAEAAAGLRVRARDGALDADHDPEAAAVPDPPEDANADPVEVARHIVLRQLTYGPRSRVQLAEHLRRRGCTDEVAETVLDRMAAVGLVDDAAYARGVVETSRERKGVSRAVLARDLDRRGIAPELVDAALADTTREDETDRARVLVEKRLRSMHGLAPDVQARRLAAMLGRKGYPPALIYDVVREAVDRSPEHERD